MKSLILCLCSLFALPLVGLAGGNTAFVEIDKVSEIKVEGKKITINGVRVTRMVGYGSVGINGERAR